MNRAISVDAASTAIGSRRLASMRSPCASASGTMAPRGTQEATLSHDPAAVTRPAVTLTAASTASRLGFLTRTVTIMPRSAAIASGVPRAQRERRGGGQDEDPCRDARHPGTRAEALVVVQHLIAEVQGEIRNGMACHRIRRD